MNFIKSSIQSVFKSFGYNLVKNLGTTNKYTKASDLLERDYGHYNSKILKKSVNAENEPIPWFTYPAIDYLKQLDLSNKAMLEWGAGNSSLFFAKKVKSLYSIEHDKDWFKKVEQFNIENQTLIFADLNYEIEPKKLADGFDIILIDGIKRDACAKVSITMINKGGLIILDNSDRHPYIAESFRNVGFIQVDFHGFGPINEYSWTTSIFLHRDFDFKPINIQPTIPIGGGY
jgi:hypothetical protein